VADHEAAQRRMRQIRRPAAAPTDRPPTYPLSQRDFLLQPPGRE
jgi:hypothetical protein